METFEEEFEFKPLTEGLGFHKRIERVRDEMLENPPIATVATTSTTSTTSKKAPSVPKNISANAKSLPTYPSDNVYASSQPAARTPSGDFFAAESLSPKTPRPSGNTLRPAADAPLTSDHISQMMANLPPALDFVEETPAPTMRPGRKEPTAQAAASPGRPQIFQPLPRVEPTKVVPPLPPALQQNTSGAAGKGGFPLPSPIQARPGQLVTSAGHARSSVTTTYRQRLEESLARAFPRTEGSKKKAQEATPAVETYNGRFQTVAAHFGAGALDAMMVTGVSTLLLVCILAITHVNLRGLLSNAETDIPTRIHLALLVLTVLQLYMLTAHSFFGSTLGEWAFELQLGTDDEQKNALFPIRAAFRVLLLTITGFLILPALSLLLKRDLVGTVSGTRLVRRI